jgi:hypothetical protein
MRRHNNVQPPITFVRRLRCSGTIDGKKSEQRQMQVLRLRLSR